MFETIAYSGLGMFVTTVHPSLGLYNHLPFEVVKDLCSNTSNTQVYDHVNLMMNISQAAC